jgi:hypothetical protein
MVYWLDPTGKILGNYSSPYNENTRLIAIDGTDIAYICGSFNNPDPITTCEAYRQNGSGPIWTYAFPEGTYGVTGGAMAQGRLYIITPDGSLTALGELRNFTPDPTSAP